MSFFKKNFNTFFPRLNDRMNVKYFPLACLSVFLDGFYCSLCKFEGDETSAFALLLCEIKEKDLVSL